MDAMRENRERHEQQMRTHRITEKPESVEEENSSNWSSSRCSQSSKLSKSRSESASSSPRATATITEIPKASINERIPAAVTTSIQVAPEPKQETKVQHHETIETTSLEELLSKL